MKKITFLIFIAIIAINLQAQIQSGTYKIIQFENKMPLQATVGAISRLVIDNQPPATIGSNIDIWEIKSVSGKVDCFSIVNAVSKKVISWATSGNTQPLTVTPNISMRAPLPTNNMQRQTFRFENVKDDIFHISPDNGGTTGSNSYVLSPLSGIVANSNVGCISIGTIKQNNYTWILVKTAPGDFTKSVKSTLQLPRVAILSENKIEIDFKTGGDNLEPKGFQKNLQITINIRNRAPIVMENVNENQTWPNNSVRRVVVPLSADINAMDLESIALLRTVVGSWNNVDAISADNWNLDKITATAIVKTNGSFVRTLILNKSGAPLFRFIYENRGNSNPNAGLGVTYEFAPNRYGGPTLPRGTPGLATITAIFGTGGDDLRGGNDNVNITIRFKSKPQVVTISNINDKANWGNWSENTVTKTIPNSAELDINDIKDIELRHTGGGGIGADNWHIDKFKLTIARGREVKVLIDKVGAPLHMFTGDTRRKTFQVQ